MIRHGSVKVLPSSRLQQASSKVPKGKINPEELDIEALEQKLSYLKSTETLTTEQQADPYNNNFTDILSKFKDIFDYNTDVARFIASNCTPYEARAEIKQVEPLYMRLNQTNKQIGDIMLRHQNKVIAR